VNKAEANLIKYLEEITMSKYFKEVEFGMPEDPGENKSKPKGPKFNKERLDKAVAEIKTEFEKIRSGDSKLTTYAIEPGGFGFPSVHRLTMLHKDPTPENYQGFLEIAKQDLSRKAAIHFMELLKEAQEGVEDVEV
jgi:hypothetical protein